MSEPPTQFDSWQTQKRNYVRLMLIASAFLASFLTARLVPTLDDAISGKPEYMRWIADRVARSIASQYGDDAAVIAVKDEKTDCRQIGDMTVPNPDDLFYVVRYSETAHSVCFVTYAPSRGSQGQASSLIMHQNLGRDYGRRLDGPIRVVPVTHVQMVFPAVYLSLLHWRAKIEQSSFARAANSKIERWFTDSPQVAGSVDVSIDFAALRADVGHRHRFVNRTLEASMLFAVLVISFGGYKLWALYDRLGAFLTRYHTQVDFPSFLKQDLSMIATQARQTYQEEQKRSLEEARSAILLKRSKEAMRGRLESILNALSDGQLRLRVQETLNRDDAEEMKSLTQQLQGQTGQKTSEERLTALLDTLKEYCSGEEFDRLCAEAFRILAITGFREARSFVVESHDQLRARSKELEEQETVETE